MSDPIFKKLAEGKKIPSSEIKTSKTADWFSRAAGSLISGASAAIRASANKVSGGAAGKLGQKIANAIRSMTGKNTGATTNTPGYQDSHGNKQPETSQQFINRQRNTTTTIEIGKMYMFVYDAKLKDVLPYWDQFPLIFPIERYSDGFLGINLHYLPPILRAKLMNALFDTINNKRYDARTKLQISYRLLNGSARYKLFKPCVKRYLYTHMRSKFLNIGIEDWDMALMLPTERFKKQSKTTVWKDSISMAGS